MVSGVEVPGRSGGKGEEGGGDGGGLSGGGGQCGGELVVLPLPRSGCGEAEGTGDCLAGTGGRQGQGAGEGGFDHNTPSDEAVITICVF